MRNVVEVVDSIVLCTDHPNAEWYRTPPHHGFLSTVLDDDEADRLAEIGLDALERLRELWRREQGTIFSARALNGLARLGGVAALAEVIEQAEGHPMQLMSVCKHLAYSEGGQALSFLLTVADTAEDMDLAMTALESVGAVASPGDLPMIERSVSAGGNLGGHLGDELKSIMGLIEAR